MLARLRFAAHKLGIVSVAAFMLLLPGAVSSSAMASGIPSWTASVGGVPGLGDEIENAAKDRGGQDLESTADEEPLGEIEAGSTTTEEGQSRPDGDSESETRPEQDATSTSIKEAKNAPRPVVRISKTSRFARAIWRSVDDTFKPKESFGIEKLLLSGYEYRYRIGDKKEDWSKWQFTKRTRSEWMKDLKRGDDVAFQVRSLWRGSLGQMLKSKSQVVQYIARSGRRDRSTVCDTQLGRQPGVAYATGGERTYVDMTTNLCMGSLLAEGEDLRLKVPGPDLVIERTYNSHLSYDGGMLGYGWISNLERNVYELPNDDVLYEDGQGGVFIFEENGGSYMRPKGLYLTLEKQPDNTFTTTDKENVVDSYNQAERLASIEDPDGNTTTFTWSGDRLTSITDSAGRETSLTYGSQGLLETITDPDGRLMGFGYSVEGQMVHASQPGDADTPYRFTVFAYDSNNRLTRTGTPELHARGDTVSNDDCGNNQQGDVNLGEAVILYNADGKVASITNERRIIDDANQVELCGVAIGTSTTYTYEFNELDCPDPVCVTDPREHVDSYILDAEGRVAQLIDAENRPIYFSHDDDSNLMEMIEFRDGRLLNTTFSYDANGNLTELKEPGYTKPYTFGYDVRNNLIWKITPGKQTSGSKTTEINRPEPSGEAHKKSGFPSLDNKAPKSSWPWLYTYSNTDHLETMTSPGGDTWSFEYDSSGNRTAVIDPENKRSSYSFDSIGRLEWITTPSNIDPTYLYRYGDVSCPGNATRYTQQEPHNAAINALSEGGDITSQTADDDYSLNWPPCYIGNGSWSDLFHQRWYNSNGSIAESCSFQLTLAHQPTRTTYNYEANNSLKKLSIELGPPGIIMACPEPIFWENYKSHASNLRNQVDQETFTWLKDDAGTQLGELYRTTYYAADSAVKDVKANEGTPLIQHHTHDAQDNDTEVDRDDFEKVTQTSEYDDANRETSRQIVRRNESPWLDQIYTYDEDDNLTSITEGAVTTTFTYDADGQLTSSNRGGQVTRWTYDGAGNRLTEELPDGEIRTYNYDNAGRLESVVCGEETCISIVYDEYGQIAEMTDMLADSPGLYTYRWDSFDHLYQVRKPDNRLTFFSYMGRTHSIRYISPSVDGSRYMTHFLYDTNHRLMMELDGSYYFNLSYSVYAVYNYDGQGNLISTTQPEDSLFRTYYYSFDSFDNIIGINDEFELKNSYQYDPWGNLTSQSETVYNPFRYHGARWVEELQMYYIGNRWYNPRIGRFISPPILENPYEDTETPYDVTNPYAFANNNPFKHSGNDDRPVATQIRREGLDYFANTNRFRKERAPMYWEMKRRIELGSPSRNNVIR